MNGVRAAGVAIGGLTWAAGTTLQVVAGRESLEAANDPSRRERPAWTMRAWTAGLVLGALGGAALGASLGDTIVPGVTTGSNALAGLVPGAIGSGAVGFGLVEYG